jgi:Protein of unknown function (DUF2934)
MEHLDEAIRERAYQLWLADGRPEGNPDNYWLNAQREMLTDSVDGAVAEESVLVAAKPEKKPKVARPRKSKRSAAA